MSLIRRGGFWHYAFMVAGRRFRGSTKSKDKRTAEAVEKNLRSKAVLGLHHIGAKERHTFAEAVDSHVANITERRSRNYVAHVRSLLKYWKALFDDMDVGDVSRERIAVGTTELLRSGKKSGTVREFQVVLVTVLHHARRAGWLDRVPDTHGLLLSASPPRDRILADAEIERLLHAAATRAPLLPLLLLGLLSGARKAELENMRWSELDLVERLWRLPAEHTKAKKARTVPLSPMAVEVFMRQPGRGTNERVWPVRSLGSRFASAVAEAELAAPRPTFHALRHSAISRLHRAGVPVGTIQRLVGHSTGKNVTLNTYTTIELADLRAAVEALEKALPLQAGVRGFATRAV